MPARDIFHYAVRTALETDGWTITDDPYRIKLDEKQEHNLKIIVYDSVKEVIVEWIS